MSGTPFATIQRKRPLRRGVWVNPYRASAGLVESRT